MQTLSPWLWPAADSLMSKRIRTFNWAATSLGPLAAWPQSLKTTVDILLRSPLPMVLFWSGEGVMLYNDAYAALNGELPTVLLGSTLAQGIFPIIFDTGVIADVRTGRGRSVQDQPLTRQRTGTDEQRWFNLDYTPVPDEQGSPGGVLVLLHETTWHVQANQSLRDREERLATIFEHAAVGLSEIALDGSFVRVNDALCRMLGRTREEVLAGGVPDVTHPDDLPASLQGFARAVESGGPISIDKRYVQPDGTLVWATSFLTRLDDARGQPRAMLVVTVDVTERTRTEEQLRQAQKMESIGQLAGGIAHDFNNLLTAIGGYAALALAGLPPDDPIGMDLSEIQHAADRAASLTRQLLAFARRQRMEMRPLDLNALVGNLEKMLRRLIGEHIQLVVEPAAGLGPVMADPGQIEQVLINLAINARDAMPHGGSLTIATARVEFGPPSPHELVDLPAGVYIQLSVGDTGVGIPAESQAHLFEPFFTTKPPGQGTGLGLATCYGIVKQHGGTIVIDSEVGRGTLVKVFLLPASMGGEHRQQSRVAATLPRGNETVLVAEDEPAVRTLAVRVLRACGYTVLEAADGNEAIQLAQAHAPEPIHLLLSDVVMPGLGGPAAAAQLRLLYPSLRVLFMSGYTDLGDPQPDGAILDAPLVQKPFSPMALATAVRAALDS